MSLLFFFLLLFLPFKFFLPLLGLGSLLPVFSGFFACILAVATCYIKDKHELFSFIQLLYTFVIACSLCYFFNVLGQSEYLYILFGFIPMLAECGMNETFYSPGRLALFSEGRVLHLRQIIPYQDLTVRRVLLGLFHLLLLLLYLLNNNCG
jgi:hypothetical protein